MQTVGTIADRVGDVFDWLAARGIEPAGAPFLRYNVIDVDRRLEVFKTDPREEPDMDKWETDLAFRLAG